jgi:hemin uptake protein HemP
VKFSGLAIQIRIIIIKAMKPNDASNHQSGPDSSQAPGEARRSGLTSGGSRQIHSASLLGAARELLIEHAGCTYRLRVTQANKLILTK